MVRVIVWTDKADEDMEQIIAHWSTISENSVRLQVQRIFEKIDLIQTFPRSGRIVPKWGTLMFANKSLGIIDWFITLYLSNELIF